MKHRPLALVAALFLVSGASGLVFEVVWVRLLSLRVGQSTVAVGLVVAAFLVGLALGGLVGGALADRAPRPLRRYAALEAVTALSALGVSALLGDPERGAWLFSGSLASRTAVTFALLALPTAAMGATLPSLTRWATADLASLGRSFGTLYALNTLGAAAGCALSGFWLVGALGYFRTSLVAAGASLAVALAAALWDRVALAPATARSPEAPSVESPDTTSREAPSWLAPLLGALTGCAAIACEVLWFRVLHAFVKSSTYALSLLLATYLTGLALGGWLYARRLSRHPRPWDLLTDLQTALAFTGLLSVALLGRAHGLAGLVRGALGRTAWSDSDAAQLALAGAVILPPTVLMGACLPLVTRLGARSLGSVGRSVGLVSAANTAGGVLGSLSASLALVPLLGAQRSFGLAFGLNLASALLAWTRGESAPRARTLRAAVAFALAWALLPGDWLVRSVAHFPRARVLEVREGRDGTAVALGFDRATLCRASRNRCARRCQREFSYQQLVFGSISYASTIPPARRYMRVLAHLPMLLHPDPGRVLELCFGTGTTAGAFTAHASLRALTLVDLNPDVLALARHFEESHRGVLSDPRVTVVIEDGRRFLAAGDDRYDVLSLEPPPPTAEGAASLYTVEFYRLARRRLGPGGVLAQWVPLEQQNDLLDRAMLRAVTDVFPYVELWLPSRLEGVVLASDRPLSLDLARWRARWSPRVAESLSGVGFHGPEALLATRVLAHDGVTEYVHGAPPVTDDLPLVEHYRAHPGRDFDLERVLRLAVDPALGVGGLDAPERLRRATLAERALMRSHARVVAGDLPGARALAREAVATGGRTDYTDYLLDLELDCLSYDDP